MHGDSLFKIVVDQISLLTIPLIFFLIIGYAMAKRVKVYESFIEGGKEGFDIFIKILPYIVAILVAIGMFRVSGALGFLSELLAPVTLQVGMPRPRSRRKSTRGCRSSSLEGSSRCRCSVGCTMTTGGRRDGTGEQTSLCRSRPGSR